MPRPGKRDRGSQPNQPDPNRPSPAPAVEDTLRTTLRHPAPVLPATDAAGTGAPDAASRGARQPSAHLSVPAPADTSRIRRTLAPARLPRQAAVANGQQPPPPAVLIRGARRPPRHLGPIVPRRQGPRSATSQFIISMVTVMLLFGALTVSSPLGKTAALGGSFQAYANALPWVPTATPSPTPVPLSIPPHRADPGTQAVINEIVAVFGPYAQGALNIAHCESGYDPNAWNPYAILGSHASGVFQILYPSTWNGTSYHASSPFDYYANIRAAYEIFSRDGYSWREWECKP